MVCRMCGEDKPVREYYGQHRECKVCSRVIFMKNRLLNLEEYRLRDRIYSRNQQVVNPDECRRRGREEYCKAKATNLEFLKLKKRAHNLVRKALAKGVLVKPEFCQDCGSMSETEAHHDDYNRPLDIRWLCLECHNGLHSPYGVTHVGPAP